MFCNWFLKVFLSKVQNPEAKMETIGTFDYLKIKTFYMRKDIIRVERQV